MLSNKRILVTGTNSGLGKFIAYSFESCLCLTRENKDEIIKECKENPVDVIIHSAFNSSRYVRNYDDYFEDNIFLTEELLDLPHEKFIYISTPSFIV